MTLFELRNAELVSEFDRYVREHPEWADRIPDNALVALFGEGDEEFKKWSREGALKQAEEGQPIVYVKIKRLEPVRSRIRELELAEGR
ncbi:MAG: DUF5647 family protein [Candidatus Binatia bacterium]